MQTMAKSLSACPHLCGRGYKFSNISTKPCKVFKVSLISHIACKSSSDGLLLRFVRFIKKKIMCLLLIKNLGTIGTWHGIRII